MFTFPIIEMVKLGRLVCLEPWSCQQVRKHRHSSRHQIIDDMDKMVMEGDNADKMNDVHGQQVALT